MTERRRCPIHNVYEDVEETKIDEITYRQKFSCGFENNLKKIPPIVEKVEVHDSVNAEVRRVRTLGEIPILVTDSSGTQLSSGKVDLTLTDNKVTIGTVNINQVYNYNINSDIVINNINNILSLVDSNNNYTPEEKEKAKDMITKVTELIKASGDFAGKAALYLPLISKLFPS